MASLQNKLAMHCPLIMAFFFASLKFSFYIEFVLFAVEFVLFAIEFVGFAIELVAFALEFVAFALEFVAFAKEFIIITLTAGNQLLITR